MRSCNFLAVQELSVQVEKTRFRLLICNLKILKANIRAYAFYNLHRDREKLLTWKHYQQEGQPKASFNSISNQIEKNTDPILKFNKSANRARLKKLFDHRRGVSFRKKAKLAHQLSQTCSKA
jgi:hypothetical protein